MKGKSFTMKSLAVMIFSAGLVMFTGQVPVAKAATLCVNTGGTGGCSASISAAIGLASDLDIINVETGTYNESPTINKSITLQANGTPVVQGCLSINANNVTVTGITFNGGGTGLGDPGAIAIVGGTSGHTISGNVLTGPGTGQTFMGIGFGYTVSNVTISGNEFTQWRQGIYINPSSNITIEGNNLHENFVGIGSDGLNNVSVLDNDFVDNEVEGWGSSNVGVNVEGHNNRFNGNNGTAVAVSVATSQNIDATDNWWGDASGPTHASNSGGSGDVVSDKVDFDPFCTDAACTPAVVDPPVGGACFIQSVK
jgi:parallel beta-helix repeat protein